jgi:hypothetical protein
MTTDRSCFLSAIRLLPIELHSSLNILAKLFPGGGMIRCCAIPAMVLCLLIASCGKSAKEPSRPLKTVEDITGKTVVKQGEYIKKKIKEFEKTEQQQTDEAINRNE